MNTHSTSMQRLIDSRRLHEKSKQEFAINATTNDIIKLCFVNIDKIERAEIDLSSKLNTVCSEIPNTLGEACCKSSKVIQNILTEISELPQIRVKLDEALFKNENNENVLISTFNLIKEIKIYTQGFDAESEAVRNLLSTVRSSASQVQEAQKNLVKAASRANEEETRISHLKTELSKTQDDSIISEINSKLLQATKVAQRRSNSLGACQRILNAEINKFEELKAQTDEHSEIRLKNILDLVKAYKKDCQPRSLSEKEFEKIMNSVAPTIMDARESEASKSTLAGLKKRACGMVQEQLLTASNQDLPQIFRNASSRDLKILKGMIQNDKIPYALHQSLTRDTQHIVKYHMELLFPRPKEGPDLRTQEQHKANHGAVLAMRELAQHLENESKNSNFDTNQRRNLFCGSLMYKFAANVIAEITAPSESRKSIKRK